MFVRLGKAARMRGLILINDRLRPLLTPLADIKNYRAKVSSYYFSLSVDVQSQVLHPSSYIGGFYSASVYSAGEYGIFRA